MILKHKKIFITGGAGFIGSHLAQALARDNQVTVYDNFSSAVINLKYFFAGGEVEGIPLAAQPSSLGSARATNKRGLRAPMGGITEPGPAKNISIINGDILDTKKLTKSIKNHDVVIHMAVACVRLSLGSPRLVHEVNATGTLNVLLACLRRQAAQKTNIKRFVYISSSEVYGGTHGAHISETHPIEPTTVYGTSKYMGEQYTQLFFQKDQLPTTIIRPFNTYGPRSHFDGVYGEVIPRFVVRALCGLQPIIFGDGAQSRDFTYVDDTVAGIISAASSDQLVGQTVNIAHGQEISITQIAKTICELTHLPYRPIYKPTRPGDVRRLAADTTKAKKILTYAPKIDIAEGLRRYIAWIQTTYPNPHKLLSQIPEKNW